MRVIKLRCWDKNVKTWVAPRPLERIDNTLIGSLEIFAFQVGRNELELKPLEGIILMQFTGLRDKNGKEIYEGDIVKLIIERSSIENGSSIETEISQVEFSPAYFRLRGSILGAGSLVLDNLEVIGNIWENPTLLKNDKRE